jgi:hypothetical protein
MEVNRTSYKLQIKTNAIKIWFEMKLKALGMVPHIFEMVPHIFGNFLQETIDLGMFYHTNYFVL